MRHITVAMLQTKLERAIHEAKSVSSICLAFIFYRKQHFGEILK